MGTQLDIHYLALKFKNTVEYDSKLKIMKHHETLVISRNGFVRLYNTMNTVQDCIRQLTDYRDAIIQLLNISISLYNTIKIGYINIEYKNHKISQMNNIQYIVDMFNKQFPKDFIEYEPEVFNGLHMEFNNNKTTRIKVIYYSSHKIRFITKIDNHETLKKCLTPIINFIDNHIRFQKPFDLSNIFQF